MNNFAISTDELATGLQKSGSTLALLGNSIDEAAALITSANSTIQDVDSVSTGIRTVALRIMGTEVAQDELKNLGEEIDSYVTMTSSKKRDIIKKYTATASNKEGVDILDENGNYKNVYNILKEIGELYKEIQEEDKKFGTNRAQALIEELGGKNRSNVVSAVLSNYQLLEEVKNTSLTSEGSAQDELNKYLESLEGKKFCPIIWKHIKRTYLIAGNA
jgi:TP901 family phage tail tape measure protein